MSERTALVTGVGHEAGIGLALARRLARQGYRLALHALQADAPRLDGAVHLQADFLDAQAPERVVAEAAAALGHLDVLVVNHAHSSHGGLGELDAAELDRALAINVRASLLLVQAFFQRHDGRPDGRIVVMTSGQHRGPMPGELAYIAGKGALHQLTASLAAEAAPKRITVNTVDPGATDTGWPTAEIHARVLAREPFGRWGEPEDAARLLAFLCSPDAGWITGQVITSSGGGP